MARSTPATLPTARATPIAFRRVAAAAAFLTALLGGLLRVHAQPLIGISGQQFQLSNAVELDEPGNALRARLAPVNDLIASEQWPAAVETVREVIADCGEQVTQLDGGIYVTFRDACHRQIASLPPPALALYRARVDPVAKSWYERGIRDRDVDVLWRVVDELFCSSYGDDALYALGEMALEQGRFTEARRYWQRISPQLMAADGRPVWLALREYPSPEAWDKVAASLASPREASPGLFFPDTDLPMSAVRARLVIVSIVEGATERAELEWELFRRLHPNAEGTFGGATVNYVAALERMMADAATWAPLPRRADWSTFAGSPERGGLARAGGRIDGAAWAQHLVLPDPPATDMPVARRRIAEDVDRLLSFHPIVADDLLLFCNQTHVFAYDLKEGIPAWGQKEGVIFRPQNPATARSQAHLIRGHLGVARFTMTAHDGRLYARLGNPVTAHATGAKTDGAGGYLLCLDLRRQGAKVWEIKPDDAEWAFEGAPICDGDSIFVGMRRSDVNPQAYVACFGADDGQLRWRRKISAVDTPARAQVDEITHNLLTLAGGTLYYNTNLGAVAALSARDGRVRWISLYGRADSVDLSRRAAHFYRDRNPCVHHQGTIFVAPADTPGLFALDATTGRQLWASDLPSDVVHVLGVCGGNLLASGDFLWWIAADTGKVVRRWPEADESIRGFGRGVIAGEEVYWPTRDAIHVFSCRTTESTQEPMRLLPSGARGGNLLVVKDRLLIAGPDVLYGFRQQPAAKEPPQRLSRHTDRVPPSVFSTERSSTPRR